MARPRKNPAPLVQVDEIAATTVEPELTGTNLLRHAIKRAETEGTVDRIIADALGAETRQLVACPDCGAEFRAPVPDVKKQIDTLIAVYERTEGKAGDKPPGETQILIVRPPL